jgi:hypothetical protein
MEDQIKIRVVDVKTRQQYLALSYRWGASRPLVATANSLGLMREAVEIGKLSRVIQDAI